MTFTRLATAKHIAGGCLYQVYTFSVNVININSPEQHHHWWEKHYAKKEVGDLISGLERPMTSWNQAVAAPALISFHF